MDSSVLAETDLGSMFNPAADLIWCRPDPANRLRSDGCAHSDDQDRSRWTGLHPHRAAVTRIFPRSAAPKPCPIPGAGKSCPSEGFPHIRPRDPIPPRGVPRSCPRAGPGTGRPAQGSTRSATTRARRHVGGFGGAVNHGQTPWEAAVREMGGEVSGITVDPARHNGRVPVGLPGAMRLVLHDLRGVRPAALQRAPGGRHTTGRSTLPLCSQPRGLEDLAGERGEADRERDFRARLPGRMGCAGASSQYVRAAEAPVPVSQYSVMLSTIPARVRWPEGCLSRKAREIL